MNNRPINKEFLGMVDADDAHWEEFRQNLLLGNLFLGETIGVENMEAIVQALAASPHRRDRMRMVQEMLWREINSFGADIDTQLSWFNILLLSGDPLFSSGMSDGNVFFFSTQLDETFHNETIFKVMKLLERVVQPQHRAVLDAWAQHFAQGHFAKNGMLKLINNMVWYDKISPLAAFWKELPKSATDPWIANHVSDLKATLLSYATENFSSSFFQTHSLTATTDGMRQLVFMFPDVAQLLWQDILDDLQTWSEFSLSEALNAKKLEDWRREEMALTAQRLVLTGAFRAQEQQMLDRLSCNGCVLLPECVCLVERNALASHVVPSTKMNSPKRL